MTRELGSHREIQIEAIDQPVHVRQTVATLKPSLQFLAIEKETSPERLPLSFTRTIEAKATEQRRELVVRLANMKSIFYEATLRIILGQRLPGARGWFSNLDACHKATNTKPHHCQVVRPWCYVQRVCHLYKSNLAPLLQEPALVGDRNAMLRIAEFCTFEKFWAFWRCKEALMWETLLTMRPAHSWQVQPLNCSKRESWRKKGEKTPCRFPCPVMKWLQHFDLHWKHNHYNFQSLVRNSHSFSA